MSNDAGSYLSRGVSPTKDDVKSAIKDMDKGLYPGAFCKISPDVAGDPDYCFALHADGAGTKSSLAYLMYKESGHLKWFRGIAQDSLVMNTDDLACIGATNNFYLSNTIGRNAHRVDGAAVAEIINGYSDLAAKLAAFSVNITLTGGETADVGDLVRTVICDSTVAVRMPRKEVIDLSRLKPGLSIVGLSSYGRSTYELSENSGIASNGLTAARHLLLDHRYYQKYPETFSDTLEESKVYNGSRDLQELLPGSTLTYGEALLSPTRTYLPILKRVFSLYREGIYGIVHCTGGGQVKARDFGRGIHYVKNNLFSLPPVFEAIYREGEISAREMYQVFNCGHLMELYVEPELARDIIDIAAMFQVEAKVIGHTLAADTDSNRLTIESKLGTFNY